MVVKLHGRTHAVTGVQSSILTGRPDTALTIRIRGAGCRSSIGTLCVVCPKSIEGEFGDRVGKSGAGFVAVLKMPDARQCRP